MAITKKKANIFNVNPNSGVLSNKIVASTVQFDIDCLPDKGTIKNNAYPINETSIRTLSCRLGSTPCFLFSYMPAPNNKMIT